MKNKFQVLFEPDHLSTSQCPFFYDKKLCDEMTMYPSGGNFGPQREDGYGVYYLFLGENCCKLKKFKTEKIML